MSGGSLAHVVVILAHGVILVAHFIPILVHDQKHIDRGKNSEEFLKNLKTFSKASHYQQHFLSKRSSENKPLKLFLQLNLYQNKRYKNPKLIAQ